MYLHTICNRYLTCKALLTVSREYADFFYQIGYLTTFTRSLEGAEQEKIVGKNPLQLERGGGGIIKNRTLGIE